MQKERISKQQNLNLNSFELLIREEFHGIEIAIYPWLYPHGSLTDSGMRNIKEDDTQQQKDDPQPQCLSIAKSWTRKCLSSVRVYAEQRDLTFFLYEKWMALKSA